MFYKNLINLNQIVQVQLEFKKRVKSLIINLKPNGDLK